MTERVLVRIYCANHCMVGKIVDDPPDRERLLTDVPYLSRSATVRKAILEDYRAPDGERVQLRARVDAPLRRYKGPFFLPCRRCSGKSVSFEILLDAVEEARRDGREHRLTL